MTSELSFDAVTWDERYQAILYCGGARGVEAGHLVRSLRDANDHTSYHLLQHTAARGLALRENAGWFERGGP